jgi:DNA helicase-2/ATP-dependent DNA helicase PcrA
MGFNFRSSRTIVQCSRRVIEHNKLRIKKEIKEFKTDEGHVSEYQSANPMEEIKYIISKCKQNKGLEIAILYRNRSYKNHLEFDLKKAGLKYCVNDSLEISDRSAIKVMISCMKLAAQFGDIYDLEIASKGLRGVGKTTVENIKKDIGDKSLSIYLRDKFFDPKNHKKFDSLISIISYFNNHKNNNLEHLALLIEKYFIKSFDYQDDMRNFIRDITKEYKINSSDIRDISNDLGLDGKEENQDKDAKIELSTIHGYKGIEREVVILPWCSMFEAQAGKNYNIEDERRLFYVGITRAKSKLYCSYSGDTPKFIEEMKI